MALTLSIVDSLLMQDPYTLVMSGSAQLVLEITETMVMSDAVPFPKLRLTQMPIEVVIQPTDAHVRLTQLPVEVVLLPSDSHVRLTQLALEYIYPTPEMIYGGMDFELVVG